MVHFERFNVAVFSQVRETMVKIMVPTASRPEPVFGSGCFGEEGQFGSLGAGDMSGNVSGMNQLLNDPAFCTFWCAVAVGGLAKGSPIESVSGNRLGGVAWPTSSGLQESESVLFLFRMGLTRSGQPENRCCLTSLYLLHAVEGGEILRAGKRSFGG